MSVTVDFVQGADIVAPGLSRAEQGILDALEAFPEYAMRPVRFPSMSYRRLLPWTWTALPARLLLDQSSLIHIASLWYAHVVPSLRKPAIVTCHDLISLGQLRAGKLDAKPHQKLHLRAALAGMRKARFIACDSAATAKGVVRLDPACGDRLRVIYLGLSPVFQPGPIDEDLLTRLGVSRPYVLYVGSEQERKNVVSLVAAIAEVRRTHRDLRFVKVGWDQTGEGRESLLRALFEHRMQQGTTILDSVTDDELVALYRAASATALISFEEGFGYPALEAMACGCPVVVSNRDSLPEVTGGDALVVDPLDVRAIARCLEQLLDDGHLARDLSQRGPSRACLYSWERTGRGYVELYREALSGR